MPSKSRRGRAKYPAQKKQSGIKQVRQEISAPVSSAQAPGPGSRSEKTAPVASVPRPAAGAQVRYPYIASELWTIGIVAGITLGILAVLALVLS